MVFGRKPGKPDVTLAVHTNGDDDAPALTIFDRRASFIPTIELFADIRVPLNVVADPCLACSVVEA